MSDLWSHKHPFSWTDEELDNEERLLWHKLERIEQERARRGENAEKKYAVPVKMGGYAIYDTFAEAAEVAIFEGYDPYRVVVTYEPPNPADL